VGEDHAFVEIVQPKCGQETVAHARAGIGTNEVLFDEGDGRLGVPDQDAAFLPIGHLGGGPRVLVVAVVVAEGGHAQVDPDHVIAAAGVQAGLELGPDDVVRRGHQHRRIADRGRIAPRAEGDHGLQETLLDCRQ